MSGNLRPRQQLQEAIQKIDKELQFEDAHLELSSEDRLDDLIEFHRIHFHPDEVLAKSLKYNITEDMIPVMKEFLHEHLSILLISDKTNEIIACRTIMIGRKDQPLDLSEFPDDKIISMIRFATHRNEEMDVYKRFNCDTAIEFVSLGTHRDFRKRGIATKMFQAALQFSKELGLDPVCIKGEGTSNFSQKIYEKFGFETIHTIKYEDYKVDGDVVFKNTGDHKTMKVYVKKL